MTGYTVHTGSTEKFAAGWDQIFKAAARGKSATGKKAAPKKTAKKAGKPKSAKKK
ncbi:MAG: hypothetical protein JSS02_14075 [Planctomycetes bacterium]|nr:hypothetical protein [Planctomycetota bacterium]